MPQADAPDRITLWDIEVFESAALASLRLGIIADFDAGVTPTPLTWVRRRSGWNFTHCLPNSS